MLTSWVYLACKGGGKGGGIRRFWGGGLPVLLLGGADGGWIHVGPYLKVEF